MAQLFRVGARSVLCCVRAVFPPVCCQVRLDSVCRSAEMSWCAPKRCMINRTLLSTTETRCSCGRGRHSTR